MASIFKLATEVSPENPNVGDLEMNNGQFVYLDEGPDMLLQRIRSRLLWWRGEWFLDQRQGTPWSDLFGKRGNSSRLQRVLKALIESMPGVAAVNSLTATVSSSDRTATVAFEVTAVEGYTVTIESLDLPYGVEGVNG